MKREREREIWSERERNMERERESIRNKASLFVYSLIMTVKTESKAKSLGARRVGL